MKTNTAIILIMLNAVMTYSSGAFIIDSFNEGAFELSLDGRTAISTPITAQIGDYRSASISSRLAGDNSTLDFELSEISSQVFLSINGMSKYPESPMNAGVSYSVGGPFSLQGATAFELDFSSVSGSGSVVAEIGSATTILTDSFFWIPIEQGITTIPFEQLKISSGSSLDSFSSLHFTFVADGDFSFTLDEIRVVPEPSSLILLLGGAGLLLIRRVIKR